MLLMPMKGRSLAPDWYLCLEGCNKATPIHSAISTDTALPTNAHLCACAHKVRLHHDLNKSSDTRVVQHRERRRPGLFIDKQTLTSGIDEANLSFRKVSISGLATVDRSRDNWVAACCATRLQALR